MIRLRGITKYYSTGYVKTFVLRNIHLDIAAGEFLTIMGPSGAGKSTLLHILGMLDTPSEGEYFFEDQPVHALTEKALTELHKHHIGFVFQSYHLIDDLTVYENLETPLLYKKIKGAERKKRVNEVLEHMALMPRKNHFPQQLSGGQQQRVAVARAVVARPKLILADEPTGNLDSTHGEEVMNMLAELHANGTAIVMVTHSQAYAEYSQRIIYLFDGQIVSENIQKKFKL